MMTRTKLALSLLLTCAALACSDGKSDETREDGSVRSDGSATTETGLPGADAGRLDGQAAETPKSDGLASDASAKDSPAGQGDVPAPLADASEAAGDGAVVEAGAARLDAAPDKADAWAVVFDTRRPEDVGSVPTDTKADTMVNPVETDGSANDDEVGSTQVPDAAMDGAAKCGRILCDCTYKGKKLWGKVQYVTSFPDFKVKESSFPDLNVKETSFPNGCGEWQVVTAFPDFKVQIVESFEDFSIKYSSFPGLP